MIAASVLADLRGRGLLLTAGTDRLKFRWPCGDLPSEIRTILQEQKSNLLAALADERQQLAALIEKTGRQWQAFDAAAHTWDADRYARQRDVLNANIDRASALLQARGETFGDYGWEINGGQWSRLDGRPGPTIVPDPCGDLAQRIIAQGYALLRDPDLDESNPAKLNETMLARWLNDEPNHWPEILPLELVLNEAQLTGDVAQIEAAGAAFITACAGANRQRLDLDLGASP